MKLLIFRRILLFVLIGILLAVGINEATFYFLKSEAGRGPSRIELVIPAGTAERVALGQKEPSIPENMVFVLGDTLVIKNEDVQTHTLGPLLVPAGTSASLVLSTADNFAYSCSFQPGKYIGLDVREPVTIGTRIYGILFGGIPLGALLGLYSLIVRPVVDSKKE